MGLFKKKKEKSQATKKINGKDLIKFTLVTFVSTAGYNLFFTPRKIVIGGIMGLGVVVESVIGMDMNVFIWIASAVILILSFIFLDRDLAMKTILVTFLVPIFSTMTQDISSWIHLEDAGTLIIVIVGGIVNGVTSGLTYKYGFPSGGTGNIAQIMAKYMKMSVGKAGLIANGIIIIIGGFFFGWTNALYALIANYITGIATDRVLLGIGYNKAFYIVTNKQEAIKQFLLDNLNLGVTVLNGQGGYTQHQKEVLLVVIPTKDYFLTKEAVQ